MGVWGTRIQIREATTEGEGRVGSPGPETWQSYLLPEVALVTYRPVPFSVPEEHMETLGGLSHG